MNEQMGTLRPVTQQENADRASVHYKVEPLGDVVAQVRFAEIPDLGIVKILDDTSLPFTAEADGFGLFDQAGQLLSWWQLIAPPGEQLHLQRDWAFKLQSAIGYATSQRAETIAR